MIVGGVTLHVTRRGDRLSVRAAQDAGPAPERLFIGKPPEEAARLAGLVFNLCGAAQEGAARAAFGLPQRRDIGRRIALESLRHHALKLCVDWPEAVGLAPDRAALAHLGAAPDLGGLARALFGAKGAPHDLAAFAAWRARAESAPARALALLWAEWRDAPASGPRLWSPEHAVIAVDFARAEIDGAPVETGLAARMAGHALMRALEAERGRGLLWRLTARLLDAARLIDRLAAGGGEDAPRALGHGPGLGFAQAARGLLLARGAVAEGRVRAFHTLTPTDCALHPEGALAAAFDAARTGGALDDAQITAMLLESVDPCMQARIAVEASEIKAAQDA